MAKSYRSGRLGEEIRRIISDLLLREIKDPRLQFGKTGVTAVDVSDDGGYATVYVSVLGETSATTATEEEKKEVLAAYKSASGLIRKEISKRVKLRHTPVLTFKLDTSLEYGMHMSQLIDSLGISSSEGDVPDEEHEEGDES